MGLLSPRLYALGHHRRRSERNPADKQQLQNQGLPSAALVQSGPERKWAHNDVRGRLIPPRQRTQSRVQSRRVPKIQRW